MKSVQFYQVFFPTLWLAWVITWWVFAINVLATVLALIAIVHRISVEEGFMREQFGTAYDSYARHVRALVPGVL
jgi:protein-S-isoprenylcysteine O-methyltransferase Ste14